MRSHQQPAKITPCFPFPYIIRESFSNANGSRLRNSKLLCLVICYTLNTTYVFSSRFEVNSWIQTNDTFRRAAIKRQKKTAYRPCHRLYKNTASSLAASACSGSLSLALVLRSRIDRLLSVSARSSSKVSGLYPVSVQRIVTDSVICTVPVIPTSLTRKDRLLRQNARPGLSSSDSASAR